MRVRGVPFALMVALLAGVSVAAPPEEEEEPPKSPPPTAPAQPQPKPPSRPPGIPPGEPGTAGPVNDPDMMPARPGAPGAPPAGPPGRPAPPGSPPGPPADAPAPAADAPPAEAETPLALTVVRFPELVAEGRKASQPALADYYKKFPVAYDLLHQRQKGKQRVAPLPLVWGTDKYPAEFGVAFFNAENELAEPTRVALRTVSPPIVHFEEIVLEETAKLLTLPRSEQPPPLPDRLVAAETVLSTTYLFHGAAREQNRRRGKSWEPVGQSLYDKLAEVRVGRAAEAAVARDWALVADLTTRFSELYVGKPQWLEPLAAARLTEAVGLAESDSSGNLERARAMLGDYDARFPGGKAPAAVAIRRALAKKARALLAEAERVSLSDKGAARNLLETAERIDPANTDLRDRRQELSLGYPTLVVGVRQRPELMSPTRARFDSEVQIAEALFEGLTAAVPDDAVGVRFEPKLLALRPSVRAGVRDARLDGSAMWAESAAGGVTAADVTGTVRLLRQAPQLWAATPLDWLADPGLDPADPYHLRLRLSRGHPDPRGLFTFKILPATWLLQQNWPADHEAFARRPFGSGPYRLAPPAARAPDVPADVVLVANPDYARRPNHVAQPYIKEIRFTDVGALRDLPAEFRSGRLHILTDVSTPDLAKFAADNYQGGTVRIATVTDSKRVHILAANHRRPALQNVDLRRGLAHAIDRNKILTEVFRAPGKPDQYHRPLAGPFPAGSWVTPRPVGGVPPLFNPDLAVAKLRGYLNRPGAATAFTILYPTGDLQAAAACTRMAEMMSAVTLGDAVKLTVTARAVSPTELDRAVRIEQNYDFAYLPLDYPDIWHPFTLGEFLNPAAAGANGRNVCGLGASSTTPRPEDLALMQTLAEVRTHRDAAGRIAPLGERAFTQFHDAMPFIPLWELNRHVVVSSALRLQFPGETDPADARRLDATRLFTGVEVWQLK